MVLDEEVLMAQWNDTLIGWNMIVRSQVGMNGARLQALSGRIHRPTRLKQIGEVLMGSEIWERYLNEIDTATKNTIHDTINYSFST